MRESRRPWSNRGAGERSQSRRPWVYTHVVVHQADCGTSQLSVWRARNPVSFVAWELNEAQAHADGQMIMTRTGGRKGGVHTLCTCKVDIIGHHARVNGDGTEQTYHMVAGFYVWQEGEEDEDE